MADHVLGIEPNPSCAVQVREHMQAEPKFSLRECLLEECDPVELSSHRFDTVFCVNVLEHIEDDAAALATFTRVVQPGGHVLIWVPAMPAAYGPLDAELGHHRRYTKRVPVAGVHAREAGDRVAALHQPDRARRLDVQRARRQVHDPQPVADQAVRNAGRPLGTPARQADSSTGGPVPGCRRPTHALMAAPRRGAVHDAGPPARILERDRRSRGRGHRLRHLPDAGDHRRARARPVWPCSACGWPAASSRCAARCRSPSCRPPCRTRAAGTCTCGRPGGACRPFSSAGRS